MALFLLSLCLCFSLGLSLSVSHSVANLDTQVVYSKSKNLQCDWSVNDGLWGTFKSDLWRRAISVAFYQRFDCISVLNRWIKCDITLSSRRRSCFM